MIESISALTLATHDMPRAVRFYAALGFDLIHGGADARRQPCADSSLVPITVIQSSSARFPLPACRCGSQG
jgi:catechol 2,3-dioxygenase-like lactoylglutathione lyase family enzyme